MKKDYIAGLCQLLIFGALLFVGWELHRMNEHLGSTMSVSVAAESVAGRGGLEVTIKEPVKVEAHSAPAAR